MGVGNSDLDGGGGERDDDTGDGCGSDSRWWR